MLAQASFRNRIGIKSGRVDLRSGTAASIPFEDEQFDKVYAVNSFHEWGEAMPGLMEARRVLKPGGLLAIVEHPHGKLDAKRIQEIQNELADQISSAGFDVVQYTKRIQLDFIHLIDKKKWQDKLISPPKEKSHAHLATRDYDRFAALHASL
jgi:SAM-dependent methyltransferase